VEVRSSARRYGVKDDDMLHAFRNALRVIELEYNGHIQLLVIGTSARRRTAELVLPPDEPERIIHAMPLRPSFYAYLR
jgi:hypothetical protein